MKNVLWLLLLAFAAVAVWLVRYGLRKWQERMRAGEERLANLVAENTTGEKPARAAPAPEPLPAASGELARQKLLFEAAHKSGEAGEPALAIQLYGRLLARYPASAFAAEARAAVEAQKKKLPKA
jgi:Arc/MetJ-type ribon-helix-helix transcriptional regulator